VLALIIGLAVLSPHPQVLQYLLLASGSYAVFLVVTAVKRKELTSRQALTRLEFALGAVALGGLMGAIQYLPVREYVPWSPRAGGLVDYARATSYAWPPNELFNAYLPQFTGILEAYWGESGIHFHSDYIGVVVLIVAGAAFSSLAANPRRREIWFWTGVLGVAVLWALGGHTPFYRIPYSIIPGTKFFRAPNSVFFVGSMAIAFLGAAGIEQALERRISRKYLYGWLAFGAVVALMGTTGMLTTIAQGLAQEQMVDRVIANSLNVMIGAWRSFAFVILAVAVLLAAQRQKVRPVTVASLITLLAAVDLWSILRLYWIFSAPASQLYASDPTIEYIKRELQPGRVIALQLGYPVRDPGLTGAGLMVHRIRAVLGYHGNQLGRYDKLLHREEGYSQLLNPNAWHLLNVRFLLVDAEDVSRYFPEAKKVAGPARDASGVTVSLFRLPGENPYAWVVPLIVKAPDNAVLGTVLDQRFDVRRAGLFDTAAAVVGVNNVTALPDPLPIQTTVTHYEPGQIALHLDAPAPKGAALMVSENYYPGWSATVNGKDAVTARADFSLIGIQLPEGAQNVNLSFRSPAYETGKIITLLALLIALGLTGAGVFFERRKIG